jgi:hypothetical protein
MGRGSPVGIILTTRAKRQIAIRWTTPGTPILRITLIETTTLDHPRNWRNPRRGSAVSQQLPDADLANHS